MVNAQVPATAAAPGACEQLTYIQATYAVSAAPEGNSAIQSLGVGDAIPAHWADTMAPTMTVAGLAVRVLGTLEPKVAVTTVADRKSTRLNSSHLVISYAVFCLKKKKE